MKLHLFSFAILLLYSCNEVPPAIDFSSPSILLKDTSYISSQIPVAQHKIVLIEDITGVRCINCPDAAKKAKDIVAQKTPDSVVVIALYPITLLDNFTRPYPGVPQLASELSKQIVETLGVPQGLPSGYVDRNIFTGKSDRNISYSEWINNVNERLREKTPVNISLSNTITNRKIRVEMKLEYNSSVLNTNPNKYAIYLIEDNIVSTQYDKSGNNPNYVHNHVLRYAFGLPLGNTLSGPYIAGKTYIKQFEYDIPSEYVIAECHLVCVVLDGKTEEVINVREIDL